jgi:transposase
VHHSWLERTIAAQPGSLKANLELQYRQLQDINRSLAEYNQQIEALAQTERYQKPVQALTCCKGIKTIFALNMITEIGDIQRFPHPRQLVSWMFASTRPEGNTTGSVLPSTVTAICARRSLRRISGATERPG